ncbi:MAG: hypothetical protein WCX65_03780 [bacterium]
MKTLRLLAISAIILLAAGAASPAHATDLLKPNGLSFEAGKIQEKDGRSDLFFASLIPQFSIGGLTAVINVNYIADREFKIRDAGRDFIVVDSVQYKHNDKFKFYYGEIKNLTFGSGFIVSNYRSDIRGNVPLNRQRGIELDLKSDDSYIKAFGTRSDLFGVRGVRTLGAFRLGATAISDADPDFEEIGIDIETNFKREWVKFYAESAKIIDYGDGVALGVVASPVKKFSAKAELRDFSSDFVPSIVDEHYEAGSPFLKLTNTGRTYGLYTSMDFFPGGEYSLGLTHESYEDHQPRTTIKARGKITPRLSGDIFYAQENFVPKNGWIKPKNSVARGILTFKLNNKADLILDYYRAYDDSLNKQDSLTFKTRIKLF